MMGLERLAWLRGRWSLASYLARSYLAFVTRRRCLSAPFSLLLQTTALCNAQCPICPHPKLRKTRPQGTMPESLFRKIVREVASRPLPYSLNFQLQGEPMLDREIFARVAFFKSMCPGRNSLLFTNGEELDSFTLDEIRRSGLDSLVVSLNAHSREVFCRINTGIDFDRVVANVARLVADRELRPKVVLSFVHTSLNADEIPLAIRHWRSEGVTTRVFSAVNRAGALRAYESFRRSRDRHGARRRLESSVLRLVGCTLPFYQMNILYNGDVIVCHHDWKHHPVLGNVGETSLQEVWNSPAMNRLRGLVARRQFRQIDPCKDCSLASEGGELETVS